MKVKQLEVNNQLFKIYIGFGILEITDRSIGYSVKHLTLYFHLATLYK